MKYELCGACAAKIEEAYRMNLGGAFRLIRLERPADNKIRCARCGRRRYGGKYELLPKMEGRRDEVD